MVLLVGLDTEFTGLRRNARVLTGCYHPDSDDPVLAPLCVEAVDFDDDKAITYVLHNAKADFTAIGSYPERAKVLDTLVVSWLLNENGQHGLKYLSERFLSRRLEDPIKQRDGVLYFGNYQTLLEDAPRDELDAYCAADARATLELGKLLLPHLEAEGLADWYWEVEEPFIRVLWEMEQRGIRLDMDKLRQETAALAVDVDVYEQEVFNLLGYRVNLNSHVQLGNVLYTKRWYDKERAVVGQYKNGKDKMGWVEVPRKGLGLKVRRKNDSGGPSTDSTALSYYEGNPVVEALLKYKEAHKVLTTYLESFPRFMEGDRLYGKFNQAGTVTGRLSSSDPNMQNIPTRGALGKRVRSLFIPADGKHLVISDLSQIEYRLLADLAGESELITAFLDGEDVHERTARLVLGLDRLPTKEERGVGKTANYAAVYGAGPRKVAQLATAGGHKLSTDEARAILDDYYRALPNVAAWKGRVVADARRFGYVTTIGGRKRRLPDIKSPDPNRRSYAERQAVNSVIQGSASDLIKVAMLRMREQGVPLLLQVHDEVVAEVDESEAEACVETIAEAFRDAARDFGLRVPVVADGVVARSWAEKG